VVQAGTRRLLLLALTLCACDRGPAAPPFVTVPVERGALVASVTATGTLSALVTVQVGSQVSGRVAELHADFNSPVKKGELLARIDPQLFQAAVEQARANQSAAEGNLAKARAQSADSQRQLARSKELAAKKLVAAADLDTAQATADAARANIQAAEGTVDQARASRHQAEINLAYTAIVSPIDGTVISRAVDVGQTVAASLQAPTLFTIAEDLGKMQVDTSVAEADVGKLRASLTAAFTVDAYPGRRFKGAIRQIRNAPQTVQNVVTYDAVIDVDNRDLSLRPGMTANVTFVYASADDALKLPNAALRFRPAGAGGKGEGHGGGEHRQRGDGGAPAGDGSHKTIFVLRDGKPEPVPVKLGISDGSFTEVVEGGLKEGDAVITESTAPEGGGKGAAGGPNATRRLF
jgi:HlyD family secretion protein